MTFPADLTSALTGATLSQLSRWRRGDSPLLVPELGVRPQAQYSFRDLMALRTVVKLRSEVSLQRIRKAFASLQGMDLTEHPSRYTLTTDGVTVFLIEADGATDLVRRPGQRVLATLNDVFAPFTNFRGENVVDFLHPRPRLAVREGRAGGWPTIRDTRVPYDTIARLVANGDVPASAVGDYYPTVQPADVPDAVDFDRQVVHIRQPA
ncbi:DUF433 domain-containing protein [Nocardia panacis]|uniref:DUF433 domain-containing protein n=1 Tax=Nocardia panacis TaxID=2340916 RepID=A0A3A4K0L8_9NOCA|nr:DUF433 domain-containing protein [Nocardia panacis]RJO77593.1 DUF433 domain-containing protein [Nocardia panacis]